MNVIHPPSAQDKLSIRSQDSQFGLSCACRTRSNDDHRRRIQGMRAGALPAGLGAAVLPAASATGTIRARPAAWGLGQRSWAAAQGRQSFERQAKCCGHCGTQVALLEHRIGQ